MIGPVPPTSNLWRYFDDPHAVRARSYWKRAARAGGVLWLLFFAAHSLAGVVAQACATSIAAGAIGATGAPGALEAASCPGAAMFLQNALSVVAVLLLRASADARASALVTFAWVVLPPLIDTFMCGPLVSELAHLHML